MSDWVIPVQVHWALVQLFTRELAVGPEDGAPSMPLHLTAAQQGSGTTSV